MDKKKLAERRKIEKNLEQMRNYSEYLEDNKKRLDEHSDKMNLLKLIYVIVVIGVIWIGIGISIENNMDLIEYNKNLSEENARLQVDLVRALNLYHGCEYNRDLVISNELYRLVGYKLGDD